MRAGYVENPETGMRTFELHICVSALAFAAACSDDTKSGAATPATHTLADIDDPGYEVFPRMYGDVDGDEIEDYCRFVGSWPDVFLSCKLGADDFSGDEYAFNSIVGIEPGRDDLPRGMYDVNGDNRADFCRFIGEGRDLYLSCNLALTSENRFSDEPNTFTSPRGLDVGYHSMTQEFVDVEGDGDTDFCRYVGSRADATYCCIRAEPDGFGPDFYDCIDGVQVPSPFVGQTECDPLGEGDCNPCMPNVEDQFNRALDRGEMSWQKKPWRFDPGKPYEPDGIFPQDAYLNDWAQGIRMHVQGFVRTNYSAIPFAVSHSGDHVGTVSLIWQNPEGEKYLDAIHRTLSPHPGGLATIGRYVAFADTSYLRLIDVTRPLESQVIRYEVGGDVALDSDRNGGVGIAKLADGGHLFAFVTGGMTGNKRETHFFRFEGALENPSNIHYLGKHMLRDALEQSPSSRKTWQGAMYPENFSMITECDTGNLYNVYLGANNDLEGETAVIHLAQVEQDDSGAPTLRNVALYKASTDSDHCWFRGGASAGSVDYWNPGTLRVVCHERNNISEDYFSFKEGTLN